MTRFHFSLQRLLDLRTAAERLQAAAIGRAFAEEEKRREASAEHASQLESVEEQVSGSRAMPAGLFHVWGLSTDAARAQLAAATDALREAESALQQEQDRFTDARSARRSLERLRDRQEADWSTEAGRQEQADSDEIARQRPAKEEA
jgi:flagellar export protein FliJ